MDHRKYSLLWNKPVSCLTKVERDMDQMSPKGHTRVELIGGPLDGQVLRETEGKFEHNPDTVYLISGCRYSPREVVGDTLKLHYVPIRKN